MAFNESELGKVLREIRAPYEPRDQRWDYWRKMRRGEQKPWIPEGVDVSKAEVFFTDPLAEYVINRIKQRLGANDLNIAVHIRGDAGPKLQGQGEDLEDWFRGARETLDPVGRLDSLVRGHQAADGEGVIELEYLHNWTPPNRNGENDKDYDRLIDQSLQDYGLGITASAPDPRSIYRIESRGKLNIVAKVVNIPLIDIKNKWSAEGFRLAYDGNAEGLLSRQQLIVGQELAPTATAAEYGKLARVAIIYDDEWCYQCVWPNVVTPGSQFVDDLKSTPSLLLMGKYRNYFRRPPYFFASARESADPDPAFRNQPLALELLQLTPYVNQWTTVRMLNGIMQATKPVHAKPTRPQVENDNAAPKRVDAMWKPGVVEYDGEFRDIPTPDMPDFDKFAASLASMREQFNQGIMSALASGAIGHSTPAWTVMQINEEQVSLLKEALDNRATMWREVLLATAQCATERMKDRPIYVRSDRISKKTPEVGRVDLMVGLKKEDFDIPFRLSVSIEALTQSQRAADTEYWRRLGPVEVGGDGTLSRETYEERIGIADRVAEQARKDREAVLSRTRESAFGIAQAMVQYQLAQIHGPEIAQMVLGVNPAQPPPGEVEGPGGPTVLNDLKQPGIGMSLEQPMPNSEPGRTQYLGA